MSDPNGVKAQELVARHQRELEQIRADGRLTSAGKRARVARSFVAARDGVAALQREAAAAREVERRRLEERLFRPPAGVGAAEAIARQASYRDALERASRVSSSPTEMRAMLDLAHLTGDDLQAQAIIAVAVKSGDLASLNAYVELHPEAEPDLQKLVDLMAPQMTTESFAQSMAFMGPTPPAEVRGASADELLRLSETSPEVDPRATAAAALSEAYAQAPHGQ